VECGSSDERRRRPVARGGAASVGTLRWLYATDGILRPRDYVQLLGQGVLFLFGGAPASIRRALGQSRARGREANGACVPSSPACREAERLCEHVPAVLQHSFRTYLWASLLGLRDGIVYDDEALHVASLVHDIAFAEPPLTVDGRPCCFTAPAVDGAIEIGTNAGWSEARCGVVAEAIALHANLYVGERVRRRTSCTRVRDSIKRASATATLRPTTPRACSESIPARAGSGLARR
jgi:hypothetical protein